MADFYVVWDYSTKTEGECHVYIPRISTPLTISLEIDVSSQNFVCFRSRDRARNVFEARSIKLSTSKRIKSRERPDDLASRDWLTDIVSSFLRSTFGCIVRSTFSRRSRIDRFHAGGVFQFRGGGETFLSRLESSHRSNSFF